MELNPEWIARIDWDTSILTLVSLRGSAWAEVTFFCAGNLEPKVALDELSGSLEQQLRIQGFHFDDLLEDCEDEMIAEVPAPNGDSQILHFFLRSCGDILLVAALRNHNPVEEERIRTMLSSISRGGVLVSNEALSRLEIPANLEGWDTVGKISTSNGLTL